MGQFWARIYKIIGKELESKRPNYMKLTGEDSEEIIKLIVNSKYSVRDIDEIEFKKGVQKLELEDEAIGKILDKMI
ncbi:MAG: hypothetical protein AABY10_04680 [Nanoarchaeota archaeon]